MKLKSTLLAAILAVFTASSSFAAADAHDPGDKAVTQKAEKADAKKPVKKHSHVEEKTNMPASEAHDPGDKAVTQKEMMKDKHDHMKEKH